MRNRTICHCSHRRRDGRPGRGAGAEPPITTGAAGGSTVVVGEHEGIVADQRPAFRNISYANACRTTRFPERVIVGGVLPEAGVTYYDVPQTYGDDALSLHRGERPDGAGRTAFTSHRSGGRLISVA